MAGASRTPAEDLKEVYRPRDSEAPPRMHAVALDYAKRGIRIFPAHSITSSGACTCPKGKRCPDAGKHPRITGNLKKATSDEGQVKKWWERWPDANIAAPTGPTNGFWVLDVDPRSGGAMSLKKLQDEHGWLRARRVVTTGGGGLHIYFEHPGAQIKSRHDALGLGLDVKGDGGYILLPPSRHVSGNSYRDKHAGTPGPAPEWLLEMLREPERGAHDVVRGPGRSFDGADRSGPIREGTRNIVLTSLAGALHDGTRSLPELADELIATNETRCTPPLPKTEVLTIAASIYRKEPCRRRASEASPEVIGVLRAILDAWWGEPWKGSGGKSERDVLLVLILLALKHGRLLPNGGVNVSVSFAQLAELARVGKGTAHRAVDRLKKKERVRGGGNGPNRWHNAAAGIVLLAPRKVEHSLTTSPSSTGGVSSVPLCASPTAPLGRHSAPGLKRTYKKPAKAAVDHLERAGGWLHQDDLASRLGMKRGRDVRSRYLEPLEKAAVVESFGKEWRLTEDWREAIDALLREEEALERARYGGETVDERQMERHRASSEAYRSRDEIAPDPAPKRSEMDTQRREREKRKAAGSTDELEKLPPTPDIDELYLLVNKPVRTRRGPGVLWRAFSDEVGVVLDENPAVVAFMHPTELILEAA